MALVSRDECERRLRLILPPEVVGDRVVAGRLAGAAVFVFTFCDAVDGRHRLRPSAVLWMCDEAARRRRPAQRERWRAAAVRGHAVVRELVESWGVEHRPWYAENSRETLRDEVFREWQRLGALDRDEAVPTTSSRPAWTLRGDFAALFDSALRGEALSTAISAWQDVHLGRAGVARRAVQRNRERAQQAVQVQLPNGALRQLRPGESSLLIKGVVEDLAPRLLGDPAVLAISESARKVDLVDGDLLEQLGLAIAADRLLPDALLFDLDAGEFWFVEAVATDGEISEGRRDDLLRWAADRGIAAADCRFLTAFVSRTQPAFHRRVSSLAWGSLVWFLTEPDYVLRLEPLPSSSSSGHQ